MGIFSENPLKRTPLIVAFGRVSIIEIIEDELYIDNKNGGSYKKVLNGVTYNYDKSLPIDWWDDLKPMLSSQHKDYKGYATQKPKTLLERIIKASSNEGDLVADFYGGSFTTAEVCKDLNRNFIGCDISQKAVNIGLERTKERDKLTLFK